MNNEDKHFGQPNNMSSAYDVSKGKPRHIAWSHEDMSGIDLSIIVHRFNVSPSLSLVRKKKQVFAQEQDKAIAEEVQKL